MVRKSIVEAKKGDCASQEAKNYFHTFNSLGLRSIAQWRFLIHISQISHIQFEAPGDAGAVVASCEIVKHIHVNRMNHIPLDGIDVFDKVLLHNFF